MAGPDAGDREASCSCGQLRLRVHGDPVRISVCHCLACQRRSGSVFAAQARFAREDVVVSGRAREFVRESDAGEARTFSFCGRCGATVFYVLESAPDVVAIPVGAFADPDFPAPGFSVWEARKHGWVEVPSHVRREQ